MKINKTCETCEFKFNEICGGDGIYKYGEKIIGIEKNCDGWSISYEYFSEIIDNMPWYIKKPFQRSKLNFDEALQKLQEDETGKGVQINIYDAIEKIYGISKYELGEILGVKDTVINYAIHRGTIKRRREKFADILCIPEEFFDVIYSKQLDELKKCKERFNIYYNK